MSPICSLWVFIGQRAVECADDSASSYGALQGRVWAGQAALQQKLVDAIGGISQAVALAKKAAGIGE